MSRAGFGASLTELEQLHDRQYEDIVEDLINPERFPNIDEDILRRYNDGESIDIWAGRWIYRMLNSQKPLQEKVALFWHQVFATGWFKGEHHKGMFQQIDMFRTVGMSSIQTILSQLARNPAMLFWLDNTENHTDEPNVNFGRKLQELSTKGAGK